MSNEKSPKRRMDHSDCSRCHYSVTGSQPHSWNRPSSSIRTEKVFHHCLNLQPRLCHCATQQPPLSSSPLNQTARMGASHRPRRQGKHVARTTAPASTPPPPSTPHSNTPHFSPTPFPNGPQVPAAFALASTPAARGWSMRHPEVAPISMWRVF